jgi:hypothetical protein
VEQENLPENKTGLFGETRKHPPGVNFLGGLLSRGRPGIYNNNITFTGLFESLLGTTQRGLNPIPFT